MRTPIQTRICGAPLLARIPALHPVPGPGAVRQEDLAGGLQAVVGCPVSSALEISAGVTSLAPRPPKLLKNTKGRCFLPGSRLTPFPSFVCSAAGAKGSGYQRRLEKALAAWLMGRRGLRLRRRMGDSGPGATPAAAPYAVFNVRESLKPTQPMRQSRANVLPGPSAGSRAGTGWQRWPLPHPGFPGSAEEYPEP